MAGLCIWPKFWTLRLCERPGCGEPAWYDAISLCMLVVLVRADMGRAAALLPEFERGLLPCASLPDPIPVLADEVKLATDLRPRLAGRLPGRDEKAPESVELGL